MKKITFSLFMMFFCLLSFSQIQVGEGTNETQGLPFDPFYGYTYSQTIYTATDINTSGTITGLQYYFSGTSSLDDSQDITIYIGHTTKTAFASNTDWEPVSGLTASYTGGIDVSAGAGWVTLTLNTPFVYNGTDNLVIAFDENMASYDNSVDDFWNTSTPEARSIYYINDSTNSDPANPEDATGTVSFAPSIIFNGLVTTSPPNCNAALSSPVDGSVDASVSGDLSWSAATGQLTGYNLKVGTTMGGSEVLTTTDVGNVTTYALGALAQSTMYYVNIVPYNAIGNATGCTEYSFTTFTAPANDLCSTPEMVTVGVGMCGTSVTGTNVVATDSGEVAPIYGNYAGGDIWYEFTVPVTSTEVTLEVATSAFSTTIFAVYNQSMACGSLVEEYSGTSGGTAGGTNTVTGLTAGDTYLLRLYDWSNNDLGDITFCLSSPPSCQPVTSLTATNVTDTNAEFNWASVNVTAETAWEYALLLDTDPAPTAGTAIAANTYSTTTLLESTDYIFYVRANCGSGDFSTWEEVAFSTTASCTDASGVAVANTTSTGTDVTWTSGTGNTSFLVEIYADGESAAGSNTPVYTNAAATGTMEAATGLDASTAYDTFVTGNCGGTATAVQGPVSFTTACDTSTPEEVPFIETFDSPCGTITNEGSSANQWEVVAVTAYGFTPNHLRYSWDGTEAANSWYITQGINLTAGQSYDLSYDYGKAGFTEKLKVAYGTGNTSADMTTILADYPDVPGTTANNATNTFTPATTGVYHFGFQVYSDADQFYLHLDNVAVDVTPPPANDECAGAETLMVAVLANGNTTNATDSGVAAGTCGTDGGDQDIWYSFTATTAMAASGASFTTDADHVVVYSGDCATVSEIACLATGENTPVLVDGTTYLVRVYNSGLAKVAGPVEITLNEGSLSTTDFDTKSLFSYYPNPVNNTLTLNAQQAITNVAVFNMLGQEVIRTAPNAVSNSVDMAKLQSGAYFVQVTVGTSVETVRIIKN
ncbi:T9SS type A sorting domain-containing protein [Lacinutrix mariniflava]|uniref:T9SS type A sorting domain-containing protein n=1 Tax=Lacinutrix mariniflava TaxID=342955 RepID=UPI0006E296E1|nr:T9SS type A sorting domain-containing protein [Lacinutrix mariniflava]